MDWEDYFPTAIAERGYDYYLQGYVTDLKTDQNTNYGNGYGHAGLWRGD